MYSILLNRKEWQDLAKQQYVKENAKSKQPLLTEQDFIRLNEQEHINTILLENKDKADLITITMTSNDILFVF